MEFACKFVYVPPLAIRKDGRHPNAILAKRSALLPPVKRIRPLSPPPPPPSTNSAEVNSQKNLSMPAKILEKLENSREVTKLAVPTSIIYENVSFHIQSGAACPVRKSPLPEAHLRKAALLPPTMKPAANLSPHSPNTTRQKYIYDLPKDQPDLNLEPLDPDYSYITPEGTGVHEKLEALHCGGFGKIKPPALPARPPFMSLIPEYLTLLPSTKASPSSSKKSLSDLANVSQPNNKGSADNGPLPGNPNVVLVSLGKILTEDGVETIAGEPSSCSCCGSVLDFIYVNVVDECYFCQSSVLTSSRSLEPVGDRDALFSLHPDEKPLCSSDTLLFFCIDISGSMSITSQVSKGGQVFQKSRLQFVQEAVLQCVERLSIQQPDIRVGIINFNYKVIMYGFDKLISYCLSGDALSDSDYLKEAATKVPIPPPLSETKDYLKQYIMGLSESGTTALGPAAVLAIAAASRCPGSKVIICTDGKANTDLGNLEIEDNDARTLLSSTIFYQDLGEYAANQGVTVSLLSIEGTDCRLDELGTLADRTGGKVLIASPKMLHPEFEQIIDNRTIATHCSVMLLLPQSLQMIGEKKLRHKVIRKVGNVNPDTEITFQFGAVETDSEVQVSGSHVSIQLQVRYKQRNGQTMLRVITADQEVTNDSSAALSSLSLAIIQLNSSQASAALAVRGRFLDARRESELQRKLMERAIEHNQGEKDKQTYEEWQKAMEPFDNNVKNFTRGKSVVSGSQPLTDAGAALLYSMKHSNRKTISLKNIIKPTAESLP